MTSAASYAVTGPENSSLRDVFSPASNGDAHIGALADCILEADKMPIQWSDMVEYAAENVKDKVASRAGVYRLSSKSDDGKYYRHVAEPVVKCPRLSYKCRIWPFEAGYGLVVRQTESDVRFPRSQTGRGKPVSNILVQIIWIARLANWQPS